MKRAILFILFAINLLSCAGASSGIKYYHNSVINISKMQESSILLLPVKFFDVTNDINQKFKLPKDDFNLKMAGVITFEMARLGFNNAFIFSQTKNQEQSLFLDIADLIYIAGKNGYSNFSNIHSFYSIAEKENIDFIIFPRAINIDFVADEREQSVQKIKDGSARIRIQMALFDVKNRRVVKQAETKESVFITEDPQDEIISSIKNSVFQLFTENEK